MRNAIIFTRHSPWTYGLLRTLLNRNCIPQAVVFEGPINDTQLMRVLRFIESVFLWIEQNIFFRKHTAVYECYRRHGSVKKLLEHNNIQWLCTDNHNSTDTEEFLKKLQPSYILLCGTRIIKPHILAIPSVGTLNAHSALLPQFRGSKSEYWILSSENYEAAGVTIHWVDVQLDTGAICLQERIPVAEYETTKTLRAKSQYLSAHLFAETLRRLEGGEKLHIPQPESPLYKRPASELVSGFDKDILEKRRKELKSRPFGSRMMNAIS